MFLLSDVLRNGAFDKFFCAVTDVFQRFLKGNLRTAELCKRIIEHLADVARGVQQRSVQIENNCFIHNKLHLVGHAYAEQPEGVFKRTQSRLCKLEAEVLDPLFRR